MPISDINGLKVAIDRIKNDPDIYARHKRIGEAARKAIASVGLKLYLNNGFNNTVTVFEVPEGTTAADIINTVKNDHDILITGSFDCLAGKVIRIGHMGEGANMADVKATLDAFFEIIKK